MVYPATLTLLFALLNKYFFKLSNTCPCQLQRHFAFAPIPSHVPLVAGKRHGNCCQATGLLVRGRSPIDRPLLKIYPNLFELMNLLRFSIYKFKEE